jgi:SPP1 family phage portal protein
LGAVVLLLCNEKVVNTLNPITGMIDKISHFVLYGINSDMSNKEFLEQSIMRWKGSPERQMQIKGFLYYDNEHDILLRKRTMIGEDGKLQVVENLPNNQVIDNQYAKLVNQKTNYLFGQPFAIETDNEQYAELLQEVFDKKFMRTIKRSGKYAYNGGIAWLYPYYNQNGEFDFRLFPGYEILPFWADSEHEHLDGAIRLYLVAGYEGSRPVIIEKVEVFDETGIHCWILDGNKLIPDMTKEEQDCSYVMANGQPLNWSKIPLIPLKVNESEIPLLKKVKSLQDGINVMISDFENNMQEDARNTILVLKNYDGTNLGEFRKNLATYGAVKVRYDESQKGGVETLEIQVNADNYKAIIEIFKKALIENGMGYDAKDDRLSGNPNQMNIQSMYSDIDIDANDTETEYQAAFDEILWFVNAHLANTGKGNFEGQKVNIIFNRDILINESEAIDNCSKSMDILSLETIIGQHPWVDDPKKELERLEEQRQKEQEEALSNMALFGDRGKVGDPDDNPDPDDDKGGD